MTKTIFAFFIIAFVFLSDKASAQLQIDSNATYKIIRNDNSSVVGKIISMDAREVLLETRTVGQIIVPKSDIKEIVKVNNNFKASNSYEDYEQPFATRYFLTTNGLPIKKGDLYAQFNLFGPEIHFGVTKDFGIGLMTTWFASPIVVTPKYSIEVEKNFHVAFGALLGTGSWSWPDFYLAVPYAAVTYGNRRNNITVSGGYGAVGYKTDRMVYDPQTNSYKDVSGYTNSGRALLSIAGMVTVNKKVSLIFDTFIIPNDGSVDGGIALFMPGMRFQTDENKAFQFGFAGIRLNYKETIFVNGKQTTQQVRETVPLPIPMLTWFRKL